MLTLVEKVLVLAELPIFSEVRSEDLAHVAQAARQHEYVKGEVLYAEGELPDGLHVLVSGEVLLRRGDRRITVRPGQSFGIWGLLDDLPRRHEAGVVVDSELLSLERDAFRDVLADQGHVAEGMLRSLASRVRAVAMGSGEQLGEDAERDFG